MAGSANTGNLISSGPQISRPVGSDKQWNNMIYGDGFYGRNTDIMAHHNDPNAMTSEVECRFNNASKQLMRPINGTSLAYIM